MHMRMQDNTRKTTHHQFPESVGDGNTGKKQAQNKLPTGTKRVMTVVAIAAFFILIQTMLFHRFELKVLNAERRCQLDVGGVSGQEFKGLVTRHWKGSRYSAGSAHSESKLQEIAIFFRGSKKASKSCSVWGVVTTIQGPTDAIQKIAQDKRFCLVVVADKKTSPSGYMELERASGGAFVKFLSVEDQLYMEALGIPLVSLLPWNHYGRKNVGYLYAIASGATAIWDFDDDNVLNEDLRWLVEDPVAADKKGWVVAHPMQASKDDGKVGHGVLNPYPLFKPKVKGRPEMDQDAPWPRGFPLNRVVDSASYDHIFAKGDLRDASLGKGPGQVQSLADHDPDMDAIYRLTRKLPLTFASHMELPRGVKFDEAPEAGLLLAPQVAAPCNAQASLHFALWGLLLPVTVHGRVSDIWRSYWAQGLYWRSGYGVAFSNLKVVQVRNAHQYLADFGSEGPLYTQSGALVDFVKKWARESEQTTFSKAMVDVYIGMFEREFIEAEDVVLVQAWVTSLEILGFEFPAFLQSKSK